jgi:hypothetical protein
VISVPQGVNVGTDTDGAETAKPANASPEKDRVNAPAYNKVFILTLLSNCSLFYHSYKSRVKGKRALFVPAAHIPEQIPRQLQVRTPVGVQVHLTLTKLLKAQRFCDTHLQAGKVSFNRDCAITLNDPSRISRLTSFRTAVHFD